MAYTFSGEPDQEVEYAEFTREQILKQETKSDCDETKPAGRFVKTATPTAQVQH